MDVSQIYIAITIIVLFIIAILIIFVAKKKAKQKPLTPLTLLAFGFVLAGIFFGDSRAVGYSLMGIGVALAIIDMVIKMKKKG